LPPVHDAMIDDAVVAQLFFDIEQGAELVGISIKSAGARRAAATSDPSLDEAHRLFAAREVGAVQLRYRYRNEEWWDTITRTPSGIRLVRISHSSALLMQGQPQATS